MPGTFRDSGPSSLKSEGVQEDDKTSTVLSTGTSPEHTRAWLTQNLGLPTEEVSTVGIKLHATYTENHMHNAQAT
ncbi:hypothetical protein Taro_044079 [Colocasia esculenta]|uniref:Uncharacterized protein n=1 Tax=Colocasia esculenta TaxID=4460 RepID=A0A843WXE0_COLES|nr:hypothetical protein [Colocasia esculenta]